MKLSNDDIERAEARVAAEVDASLAKLSEALHGGGSDICISCNQQIEPRRRQAMPSAKRGIECQAFHEAEKWHR